MTAADVARDQRERLRTAMAELVAERGYSAVRISDLTALAGVSRPTFYDLFEDKEGCLVATYDEVAGEAVQALADAARGAQRRELHAVLQTLAQLALERPEQVSLLVLGSLGAGAAVRARREATLRALSRRMLRQRAAARGDGGGRQSGGGQASRAERLLVTMLIGGVREVTAQRLRHDRAEELDGLVTPLTEWIGCYRAAPASALEPPAGAAERRGALESKEELSFPRTAAPGQRLPSGRHDLGARYVALNQRERILDAVAAAATADGYAGLAIPAIAKRAHVSHQTFYEHFHSKQEAFLAAMRSGTTGLLRIGSTGFRAAATWPEAVSAGTHMLLGGLAAERDYARLCTVEALAGGPDALDLREQTMGELATLLDRGAEHARAAGAAVPEIAAQAIVGGAWQVIHLEVAAGRTRRLPLLAPLLTYFALTPYLGAKEAARLARRRPPR
ncbi:MAG: TetR/AcrR family transcriptional regulator [Solirubrobacteraceae bacterium]